ncbi:MAG: DUF928 domain-containing protein [Nostoc sp. NOS(2021)]|uniref:DUF928 domain-containing protein n=1 Tax=Nostoc sp. NOS(2021) TaxID=2815407 RepID=UPI0025E4FAA1|nr:DUF928 domain-containing protein [Nostoc sp. NOS(2021)]MBN3898605.1 DUF928 domain-containing protein [Nostoc sp. NOS(2021)]
MKLSVQKIQILLAVSLTFLSCIDVQAQPANRKEQLNQSLIFAAPPPPPDIGEPGKRTEAGSRGCGQDINKLQTSSQKRLTALVPVYSKSELVFGTTIAKHPSFLFYVPYASDFASGEFVLEDEAQNQTIYKTSLTGTPGVVNLRLPSKAAPLEIGKQYRWYFNIYCQKDNQIIANVEGYVKREQLNPALKTQLEKATPLQQVNLYAANGIWYEALSAASELRRTNSQDTSWTALLKAVGLNDFATEPKVECCNLESE